MSHAAAGRSAQGGRPRRVVLVVTLGLLAAAALWFGVFTARGGHLFMVQTPSMGRAAPVGTLVVTEPVGSTPLHVGEVISFRPPGISRVYTHRIIEVTSQGLRTKGDLNTAADGWVVPTNRVVGRATHLWFGLGWLVRMLPWLAGGALLTMTLARWLPSRHRNPVRILGTSLSISVALMVVRPLVRAETIGFVPVGTDGVRMSVVGTGLLPVRATSLDKKYVDVVPGQLGWVETHKTDSHGRFQLLPKMHLPWWGWVLVALFCLLPLAWSLLVREHTDADQGPDGPDDAGVPEQPDRSTVDAAGVRSPGAVLQRLVTPVVAALSCLVLVVGLTPSQAAFTASLQNSTDTVATRTFFTCLDAMQFYKTSTGHNGELYAGYAMGNGTGVTGTTDQQTASLGSGAPYTATGTNVTQNSSAGGCVSDWTVRQQGYATFNGTSSTWDLPAGSSTSPATSDPGNEDNMVWNIWMRTTTTKGGVLSCPGGTSNDCNDRTTWMNNSGQICFGVQSTVLCTSQSYNDGKWHMVTTRLGSAGMYIWVDAAQQAANTSVTSGWGGLVYMYPQWGYSSKTLNSAYSAQAPTSLYFGGDLQMGAIFGGNASGTLLQLPDITAIYQSAMP